MPISPRDGGVRLRLYIQPRASRTEVAGLHDDVIRIRLAAPPVDGAANKSLVRFLARRLGVRQSEVTLAAGQSSRRKTVDVTGLSVEEARTRLLKPEA